MTLPSIWANLRTSACWARDRQDDDLLLAVEGGRWVRSGGGRRGGAAGVGRRCDGGSSVPMTCMPWSSSLTLVLLRPVTTVIELSAGLTVMTGNLSPVRPTTMST